ncbi:MAG TPA: MFS transporter [Caldilineaceae bacterium]|nr:MFS transporter [Caldilineaceae bacterium]
MATKISLQTIFRPTRVVPEELRPIFFHLYWDIAWFGILSGSSISFLSVYAARLGASAFQIGLLTAGPAVIGLAFTLPAGRWLQARPVGGAVFWSALLARLGYLFFALLPFLLTPTAQIMALVALVLLMTLPGTILAIGFNALYASAVPLEWRGHVVGIRNALLALIYVVTSLLCGWLLNNLDFAAGYTLIFALGFIGAAMSTFHLWFLRDITGETVPGPPQIREVIGDLARPGDIRVLGITLRTNIGLRAFTRGVETLQLKVLRGSYGRLIVAFLIFHIALYIPIPLFPLYWVERLHFTDGDISLGTAAFHCAVLFGSLFVGKVTTLWGNRHVTAVGALLLSLYPLLTGYMTGLGMYILVSIIGGLAWSLVGAAIGNYLLENVPATERPPYLAWYNLALNLAILLGSMIGPVLADQVGLVAALTISFVGRALGGLAIWLLK